MGTATGWEASALVWYGEVLTTLGDPQAAEPTTVRVLRPPRRARELVPVGVEEPRPIGRQRGRGED
jgi:hypothetical protein